MKREVYLHEFNILMEDTIFLPVVSGLLQAYAQSRQEIRDNYEFMPFIFFKDKPDNILMQYHNPAVAAFSCSMWNMNLNLVVARLVKEKFHDCLIVFGGHQVPREGIEFLKQYPFVDVAARGEGELIFELLLHHWLNGERYFQTVPNITYRAGKEVWDPVIRNDAELPAQALGQYPSPYLEGLYDYLFPSSLKLQPIFETNRGCPFHCSFCSWSESTKLRLFSMDRVKRELDWAGEHKIEFVLCADANFGMLPRDLEIAGYAVETQKRYGYPKMFRVFYSKNTEEATYQLGMLLHKHDLTKAISMARESNNPEVLQNIGRSNIKMSVFDSLQNRFNEAGVPTQVDMILGLPGETYDSFVQGLEGVFEASFNGQLIIFPLTVLPNTELADLDYREKFGIKTVRLPLNEMHGSIRRREEIDETEELVIATNTLPKEKWEQAMVLMWVVALLHSLKIGFFVSVYLHDRFGIRFTDFYQFVASLNRRKSPLLGREVDTYWDIVSSIQRGLPRGQVMTEFSNTYWEVEEASYLRLALVKEQLYGDLLNVVLLYLREQGLTCDIEELWDVIVYQVARIPSLGGSTYWDSDEWHFIHNIPEYFEKRFTGQHCQIERKPQVMRIRRKTYLRDKQAFAREVLLYGRKSEKMLNPIEEVSGDESV